MFAPKTEVLGQSGTTVATGLTSFVYLKYQNKNNIHKIKDTKMARFEGKNRVDGSRCHIARDGERNFVLELLHKICKKCRRRRNNV